MLPLSSFIIMIWFVAVYGAGRQPQEKIGGHHSMLHASNGHNPLRHTTSYDESYAQHLQQQNQLSPPSAGLNANMFTNSDYYAHCNEQKYRPPSHPDLCKFGNSVWSRNRATTFLQSTCTTCCESWSSLFIRAFINSFGSTGMTLVFRNMRQEQPGL